MKRTFRALYLLLSLVPSLYSGSFNHFWTLANKQDLSSSPASAKEGFFLSLDQNYFPQLFCSGSLGTQI